jgi:hypothetical protein
VWNFELTIHRPCLSGVFFAMATVAGKVSDFFPTEDLTEISQHPEGRSADVDHPREPTQGSLVDGGVASTGLQHGVEEAEAVAAAWSKRALVAAYAGYILDPYPILFNMSVSYADLDSGYFWFSSSVPYSNA